MQINIAGFPAGKIWVRRVLSHWSSALDEKASTACFLEVRSCSRETHFAVFRLEIKCVKTSQLACSICDNKTTASRENNLMKCLRVGKQNLVTTCTKNQLAPDRFTWCKKNMFWHTWSIVLLMFANHLILLFIWKIDGMSSGSIMFESHTAQLQKWSNTLWTQTWE